MNSPSPTQKVQLALPQEFYRIRSNSFIFAEAFNISLICKRTLALTSLVTCSTHFLPVIIAEGNIYLSGRDCNINVRP